MLTWIRNKSTGLFMTIVMGILILAFALWGVGDYFAQSSNDKLATVNGATITYTEFNTQFNGYKQNMISQFGDGFDPSYFDTPVMRRNYLESMISNELVKQVAKDNGYTVTAEELRGMIEEAPAFKDENGQFDKTLYAAFLTQTNQSAQLLQMKLEDEQSGRALNGMLDVTSFVTPFETEKMAALNKQTRDINYINITQDQFLEEIELTDDEIETYYNENSNQYMTDEQVSVNYIELNAADVAQGIEISDAAALESFEQNKERFRKPEQRLASHILVSDNDEAESVLEEIQAKLSTGESFADLAKTYSQDPGSASTGGDLGWVAPEDMVKEFEDSLFAMEVNSISEPVKTQFGFHIIQLNEVRESGIPVFEEVKNDIIQELQAIDSETVFLEKASDLSEHVLDAQSGLEVAAEASEIPMMTTELFSRSGGLGVAGEQNFINAAFSSTVKDDLMNSEVVNITDTHVVFMHLNEVKAAELKPLDEVKENVITALKNQKAAEKAKALAEQIIEQYKTAGTALTELAAQYELAMLTETGVARTGSTLPFNLVKGLYELGRPADDEVIVELLDSNGSDVAVVELLSVNDVDLSTLEDIKTESSQLARNIKANEQQLLIQALRENATVTINEDMLNQVLL